MEVLTLIVGAIVEAMVSTSWPWMRQRVTAVVGRGNATRAAAVGQELDRARTSLSTASGNARPLVEYEMRGLLAREVLADPSLIAELLVLHREIKNEHPTLLAGRDAYVAQGNINFYAGTGPVDSFPSVNELAAMPAEDAARRLEGADPGVARDRLSGMPIESAVARLAVMDRDRAQYLLSYLDGERAARLLRELGRQVTHELLLVMRPSRAGIILQYAPPIWVRDRLAALPDIRALAILAAVPQQRRAGIVHVMEHQQAFGLLSAVGEVVAEDQIPIEEAQREAERILAKARREAEQIVSFAAEQARMVTPESTVEPPPIVDVLGDEIMAFLTARPGQKLTAANVAHGIHHSTIGDVEAELDRLAERGLVDRIPGARGARHYRVVSR